MRNLEASAEFWKRQKRGLTNPKGIDYTPCTSRENFLEKHCIIVVKDNEAPFGYRVYQNGKEHKVRLTWSQYYRNGATKNYPAVCLYFSDTGRYRDVALSRLIYLEFMGDIPKGYVVDHIDNDPMNNSIENLQILTRSENTKKNAVGHNQFTKKDELVHKAS